MRVKEACSELQNSYTKEPTALWKPGSLTRSDSNNWSRGCCVHVFCLLRHTTEAQQSWCAQIKLNVSWLDSPFVVILAVYVIPMCCHWSWGESWQCGQQQEAGWGLVGGPEPCQQWQSCEFLCQIHGWGSQWSFLKNSRVKLNTIYSNRRVPAARNSFFKNTPTSPITRRPSW